jgi:glutamyl-tRNA synthetase
LKEMAQNSVFFFAELKGYDEKAAKKNLNAEAMAPLRAVIAKLTAIEEWTAVSIHVAVNEAATALGVGLGKVAQPVRVAVSGTSVSPPIDVTLEVLGRETTLARLSDALKFAES